jgi:hypothetical protein
MRVLSLVVAVSVALATSGCSGAPNPDPRQPSLEDIQRSGLGGWVQITTIYGVYLEGELISVEGPTVRIFPAGASGIVSLTKAEIANGRLFRYVSDTGFGGWGVIGTISTLSHGAWLIFSAPIWMIWTGITTSSEGNHVISDLKPGAENWAEVSRWARFPQGMPRGFAQPAPGATDPARSGNP